MPEQSEGNSHTSEINVSPVLHTTSFPFRGQKMDSFAPHGVIKSTLWPASKKKDFFYPNGAIKSTLRPASREKHCILRVWSLMPEQSEGNNHTSKINVSPVLHTIFFLLEDQEMDFFAPQGTIKCTLWSASRKNYLFERLSII